MASELFNFPFDVARDVNGSVVPGAKLYFYLTGTSTPTDVYADSGLVTPLSNPVVANSAGVWSSIYYDTAVTYRVVLKDASNVTMAEADPYIPGVAGEVTAAMQAMYEDTVASAAAAATSEENAAASEANVELWVSQASFGYHYHPTYGTRFRGYTRRNGAIVDVIAPELYWDPFKVGAAGDGSTHEDAVKTSAEVRSWLASNPGARTVAVHASDQSWIRDQIDLYDPNTGNGSTTRNQLSLVSYSTDGSQKLAFFNGMDKVNAASWAAHGTIANAYQVSWTHSIYAVATANLRVFQTLNGKLQPLNRVQTEAETSTAGTYWYDNTLSAAGTETVVAHFWGSTNPTTQADGFAEITKREFAFGGRYNCFVQGIAGFATASNNGSLSMYSGGAIGCLLEEGTKHNWVAGATDFRAVVCYNAFSETNYVGTATTPALATVYTPDPDNATYSLTDCYSICDPDYYDNTDGGYSHASAFYCHGTTSAVGRLILTGGGDNCINWGSEALAHTITGYTVKRRGGNAYGLSGANMTVSGCLILDAKNGINGSGTVFDLEGNVIVSSVGGNTADINTSAPNARVVRNMINHPSSQAPRILLSGANSPIIEENVLDLGGVGEGAVQLNASPTGTMRLNKNYYLRPADPPGGSYPNLLKINVTTYADLADVQALGYEADGGVTGLDVIADAKFTSGQAPTPTALDVRFDTDSPVINIQTEQISQTTVNALDDQVTTLATRSAIISFIEAYDWYPVRVQLDADTAIEPDPVTVDLTTLPTSLPATAGLLWNNGGSLAVAGTGTGTVTSVGLSGGITGLTVTGSPITTSGTFTLSGTLAVANGGTGTSTAFTAGSVVFAGASGVYSQDNANLFWNNTNDRLGIGTASPSGKLSVAGTNGTVVVDDAGTQISYSNNGFNYLTASGASATIQIQASGASGKLTFATNAAERMRITSAGNVAIGSTSASYLLDVNGTARAANAILSSIPTSDPGVTGQLWNASGAALVSGSSLGLWDYWVEILALGGNMSPWGLGLISSGTASTAPPTAALKGYNPWGQTLRSSATVDSGARMTQTNPQQYFGVISQKFRAHVTPTTAFTNSTIRTGFIDTTTVSDCTDGAYFEMNGSGVVSAKTAAAGTRTTSGTTYTLTIDTPYVFDVEVNAAGTSARFRIYAGQSTTPVYDQSITTNIPTSTSNLTGSGVVATNSGGAAVDICVVHMLAQGTVAGFNRVRG